MVASPKLPKEENDSENSIAKKQALINSLKASHLNDYVFSNIITNHNSYADSAQIILKKDQCSNSGKSADKYNNVKLFGFTNTSQKNSPPKNRRFFSRMGASFIFKTSFDKTKLQMRKNLYDTTNKCNEKQKITENKLDELENCEKFTDEFIHMKKRNLTRNKKSNKKVFCIRNKDVYKRLLL